MIVALSTSSKNSNNLNSVLFSRLLCFKEPIPLPQIVQQGLLLLTQKMEDLEIAEGSVHDSPLPQALDDAEDPLRPEIEEENDADAPIAVPDQDVEVTEDKDDLSDDDSILSEIDEAQFDAFDPSAVSIEERPVPVDENNIALIGTHKRKRADGEGEEGRKKKREGKREKSKKSRAPRDENEDADVGGGDPRKASRKKRDVGEDGERRRARRASPDEETLTPEESEYSKTPAVERPLMHHSS